MRCSRSVATDEARAQYEQALAALEPGIADRAQLEMKLSDVAAWDAGRARPPTRAHEAAARRLRARRRAGGVRRQRKDEEAEQPAELTEIETIARRA